jgi:hypothetical protein
MNNFRDNTQPLCLARVYNNGKYARCSRKTKQSLFCGTHSKKYKGKKDNITLQWEKFGRFDQPFQINKNKNKKLDLDKIKVIIHFIRLKQLKAI